MLAAKHDKVITNRTDDGLWTCYVHTVEQPTCVSQRLIVSFDKTRRNLDVKDSGIIINFFMFAFKTPYDIFITN